MDDFTQIIAGGGLGALILYAALQVFNRLIDRTPKPIEDATPRWFDLASSLITAFDGLTKAISDLNREVQIDSKAEHEARQTSTSVLESLAAAVNKAVVALEDVVKNTKDIKGMADDTKTRADLDEQAAIQRHGETTLTLTDHTKRLTEIETAVGGIKQVLDNAPLVKPNALETLNASITGAITAALDLRLPNIRADPKPETDTHVESSAAVTVVVTPTTDKPVTEPEDKTNVNPS